MQLVLLRPPYAGQNKLEWRVSNNRADTVGHPPITEIGMPHMPSLKAKKLSKFPKKKYS
jgi:hypothetical protein